MNRLDRVHVYDTGTINGHCSTCRTLITITKKDVRECAKQWYDELQHDLKEQIEQFRALTEERNRLREQSLRLKRAVTPRVIKDIRRLRDACNAMLEAK